MLSNLGGVLQDLADLPGARATLERALGIDETAYGADHPEVARDVNNLGLVLKELGDLPGARAAFEQALGINETAYGDMHPLTAAVRENLASLGG
jgi:tetratricopeptide (TPR) repeat protein